MHVWRDEWPLIQFRDNALEKVACKSHQQPTAEQLVKRHCIRMASQWKASTLLLQLGRRWSQLLHYSVHSIEHCNSRIIWTHGPSAKHWTFCSVIFCYSVLFIVSLAIVLSGLPVPVCVITLIRSWLIKFIVPSLPFCVLGNLSTLLSPAVSPVYVHVFR